MRQAPKGRRLPPPEPGIYQSCREVFEPRCGHPLTDEDCREITVNLVGFFRVLAEWQRAEDARKAKAENSECGPQ
jgi:hypothetical protein